MQIVQQKIKMDDKEFIAPYYESFKAIWEHYAVSAIAANQDAHLPDGEMQAMHFIYGLSHNYSQFRDHTLRKVLEMPKSLREAYDAVCDHGTNSRAYFSSDERSERKYAFSVTRGRGGRGNSRGGGRGGRGKSGGRGACAICGQHGHWKNECPNKGGKGSESEEKNIAKAIKELRFEKAGAGATKSN